MQVRLLALLLALSCPILHAAAPPAQLTPAQRKRLEERDRLLARFRQRAGKPDAGKVLLEIVELERELYGRFSQQVHNRLSWVVILQEGQGEYRAALTTQLEMVRIEEQLYGKDHYRAVDARWKVVTARKRINLTAEEKAEHRELFRLNARVRMFYNRGRPAVAVTWARKWLELTVKLWGNNHPNTANVINNVGAIYMDLGDFASARKYLEEAGKIYRQVLGEKHPAYGAYLNNLSSLHEAMRDGRGAVALSERAVAIFRITHGEYSSSHATSLNTLAVLYLSQGDIHRARSLLEKALAIRAVLGREEIEEISVLHNLGVICAHQGDNAKAVRLHERGLDLTRRLVGEDHPLYASGLGYLAMLQASSGRPRSAYRLAMHAQGIRTALFPPRHPHLARSCRDLAQIDLVLNRLDRAAVYAGQALSISFAHLEGAVSGLSGRQRLNYIDEMSHTLDLYLTLAADRIPAGAQYEWVTRYKGLLPALAAEERLGQDDPRIAGLLDQLRQARGALARLTTETPSPATGDRWRQTFDRIEQQKEALEIELAEASTGYAKLRARPTARAVAAVLPRGSALVEFVSSHHLSIQAAQPVLLAFVLRPDRDPVRIVLGDLRRIVPLIHAWREPISAMREPHPLVAAALRKRLWVPLEKHLTGVKTVLIAPDNELYRLPFAALPGRKAGTFLLEEYAFMTVSSGRQLLLPTPAVRDKLGGLLVLGGLEYGSPRASGGALARPTGWPALPGTGVEAARVARMFRTAFPGKSVKRLAGEEAARSGLIASLQTHPRWLHLATHGYIEVSVPIDPTHGAMCVGSAAQQGLAALTGVVSASLFADRGASLVQSMDAIGRADRTYGRNPMLLTSLVLSNVNRSGDEGYLTAEEIAALDLRGCELAVLSACETGLGKLAAWQGVQGLQQGFHQAGVGTVLSSLWSVSDAATAVLMEEFYKRLWGKEKISTLEALRQAQLFVLKNPERIRDRARELRATLVKRGVSEEMLDARGIGKKALLLPPGSKAPRSPLAWWAPWVLSGSGR